MRRRYPIASARRCLWILAPLSLSTAWLACSESGSFITVTLNANPGAVGQLAPPNRLNVVVSNKNVMADPKDLGDNAADPPFDIPYVFGIKAHERTGGFKVDIKGMPSVPNGTTPPAADLRTCAGTGTVDIPDPPIDTEYPLSVTLFPNDFPLNSRTSGIQVPSDVDGFGARQLGMRSDGSFALIYQDVCSTGCQIFGRLFDPNGVPAINSLKTNSGDFPFNPTASLVKHPALAVSSSKGYLLGAWLAMADNQIHYARFDQNVAPLPSPASDMPLQDMATGTTPADDAMVTPGKGDSFLAVWTQEQPAMGTLGPLSVHGRIIDGGGTRQPEFLPTNTPVPAGTNNRAPYAVVNAVDSTFLVAWTRGAANCNDDDKNSCQVLARWFDYDSNGARRSAEVVLDMAGSRPVAVAIPKPPGPGYLIAWRHGNDVVARRFRTDKDAMGNPFGTPIGDNNTLVATAAAGTHSEPAAASSPDGHALIVWTDCNRNPDHDCNIYGRALLPFGLPAGPDFIINKSSNGSIAGIQEKPSVVASSMQSGAFFVLWRDTTNAPDRTDRDGIRGRFIYPTFDLYDGTIGAHCTDTCGKDLKCAAPAGIAVPSDAKGFCHPDCKLTMACPGGGSCRMVGTNSVCVFN